MIKSKSISSVLAVSCFALAVISSAVLLLIRDSSDDLSQVLVAVSFGAAIFTVVLSIAVLFRKKDGRGITILMMLVSLIILAVYAWMHVSRWILEQSLNEMMNAQ
jgi:hypothetical protein